MLHRFAVFVRQDFNGPAILLILENWKTLAEAKGEVEYCASFLFWCAEEAVCSYGDIVPTKNSENIDSIV